MRPRGTYGPVAKALIDAAGDAPGQVRELCARAGVGYAAGQCTASRLVAAGALVVLNSRRPAVLASADVAQRAGLQPDNAALRDLAAALHPRPRMTVLSGPER